MTKHLQDTHDYLLLAFAETQEFLHVVVEGPRPRHMTRWGEPPQPYHMRALLADADGVRLDFRSASGGSSGPPNGPYREVIHAVFDRPTRQTATLAANLVDDQTGASLWSATVDRENAAPGRWLARPPRDGGGFQFLGAGSGLAMFYVLLEGPFRGSDRQLRYSLRVDGGSEEHTWWAGQWPIGSAKRATREAVTIGIVRPAAEPSAFELTLSYADSGQALFRLEAGRAP